VSPSAIIARNGVIPPFPAELTGLDTKSVMAYINSNIIESYHGAVKPTPN